MNLSNHLFHRSSQLVMLATCAASAWGLVIETATAQSLQAATMGDYAQLRPVDVELDASGALAGRVLGMELSALPCQEVALYDTTGQIATSNVDHDGSFRFHGLSGGVYQFVVGDDCRLIRVWAHNTAPPSAAQHVVFDRRAATVRGQYHAPPFLNSMARGIKYGATKPLVVGSVLAVAVGVPVIVHNIEQDDQS